MRVTIGDWVATDKTREYINVVLDSGRISYGPMSQNLERAFAALHNCEYGILSNSGTSSLQVALQTLKEIHGWQDGDEVIVPATTFVATVNVVLHNNLKPVLVDVDRLTYNINVNLIPAAITERTRAIIPVHLFGQAADMPAITEIANQYELLVIEDACEAAFAMCNGSPVGSFSDIACFSFYMSHHLNAGVGGIATTNNKYYAQHMRRLVNHGWERKPKVYHPYDEAEAKSRYHFTDIGHSFRITELEAAIALSQIDDYHQIVTLRRLNASVLSDQLAVFEQLQLPWVKYGNLHSYMMYPIMLLDGDKWELIRHLETNGIETRECLPLVSQPCYAGMWEPEDYPASRWIEDSGFYIGCHQHLDAGDMSHVIDTIGEYFNGKG